LLIDRYGRKPFIVAGFLIIAVAGFSVAFVVSVWHTTVWQVIFAIGLMVTVGSGLCTAILFTYTSELYPTRIRGLGVAAGSSILRLAGIVAPMAVGACLAAGLGVESEFVMFGIAAVAGAVIAGIWGVETRQKSLEALSP
jgi:putative MFS transporter